MVQTRPIHNTDPNSIHSHASGTKSKVKEIDITTVNEEVNVIYE